VISTHEDALMSQRHLPIAQLILVLICVPVFLALAIPSAWLLAFAQSWRGHGLAGLGLALAIFPSALLIGWIAAQKGRAAARFWHRFAVGLGVAILALGLALLLTTPTGYPRADSPVSHQFVGERRFPRFTPTNIIPEVEQVNAGFWAAALLDPYIDWAQKREVSAYTFDLYREMERDPDFRALGSAMGWAYTDLLGFPPDVGHYYLYVPENRPPGPLPAIVYLHGAAGNFKSYTWAWSRLAEEQGYVIIAPSFGFGDWRQPGGVDAVLNALDDAEQIVALDPARIYLAGLSNGGYGVSEASSAAPERFRGLIFLSPGMPIEIIGSPDFHNRWASRPVLVMAGGQDRRISLAYVDQRVALLESGGVDVTYITYPNADHFLFFDELDDVLGGIEAWLEEE
jgi:pimeloyl-ACP methyl ester carboxylesterase